MKVIAVGQYDGKFKNKVGEDVSYSKVMLVVSENGNYPKMISVDIPVYQECGQKLIGKDVEILYKSAYGKMKADKIIVLN